jgi:acetylglutamate kinase
MEDIRLLKQALPYIKEFRNKVFVIKLGGEVVSDPERLDALAEEISLLHELNIRQVIIHGGGPQLSETAEKLGIEAKKVGGRRITDDSLIEVAKMVFAGGISTDILAALRRHGTPGVGLSGVDGDLIQAVRRPPRMVYDEVAGAEREVDFQNVGDIRAIRPQLLRVLLNNRFVPVVASLGCSDDGKVLNINADTIAAEIAAVLPAEKLFLMTNVGGVLKDLSDPSSRYSYLTLTQTREMIQGKKIGGGMTPKLVAAVTAVNRGVKRAHIINGLQDNALLYEVFTVQGAGTMILDQSEESVYLDRLKEVAASGLVNGEAADAMAPAGNGS